MSIFGHLEDLPFSELARVTQTQTGTLFLRTALAGRSVEMHLQTGILLALFVDGFPVRDEQRVLTIINQLVDQGSGTFDFQSAHPTQLLHDTTYWLNDLLHRAHARTAVPEMRLPHPETRFIATRRPGAVAPELQPIWQRVEPLLEGGASAVSLARQLQVSEHQARTMLYSLRAVDLIAPLRAASSATTPVPPLDSSTSLAVPITSPPVSTSPMRRLLGTLRRLTQLVAS